MNVRQLEHHEVDNDRKRFPLRVVAENIHSPGNIGLVFRTSEAMGVERLYLSKAAVTLEPRKFDRAARSTQKLLSFEWVDSVRACILELKKEGFTVFGLELTNDSHDLRTFRFASISKLALVIGTERNGISEPVLAELDGCLSISMYGVKTSMNVAAALAIALYEITQQWEEG